MTKYLAAEPAVVSAWAASIGAGATVVAAVAAVSAAVIAVRTLNASRRDSSERTRPLVLAELRPYRYGHKRYARLVIRNVGPTPAYNVRLKFDPELKDLGTRSGSASAVSNIIERYKNPILTLMPGVELSNVYFIGHRNEEAGVWVNDEKVPDHVTVTATYGTKIGALYSYTEVFDLDMNIHMLESFTTSSLSEESLNRKSAEATQSIAKSLEAIATSLQRTADK
ncbi:hypothetical protein ACN9MI_08660 [Rhodococcoides fascians]|jgi:hypothetical protein|uniref:hypothetical protein n=1 Tax=Rhodococcoides fascians TaxID=1828 RepID=UPI003CED377B